MLAMWLIITSIIIYYYNPNRISERATFVGMAIVIEIN